jgi:putative SOS response-associated peptidase YedK
MCGRYALPRWTLESAGADLEAEWRAPSDHPPCYNVAPTHHAPVARSDGERRVIDRLRWGLIPRWATDASIGTRLVNARSESVADKPAFRDAFRWRRCLVPAGGFYEWQRTAAGRLPHWIHPGGEASLIFAGLWESWRPDPEAEPLETFTILTTCANEFMRPLHDRMPVILDEAARAIWLDPEADPAALQDLLKPAPESLLEAYPVDRRVGSPREDDARLIEPYAPVELELPLL